MYFVARQLAQGGKLIGRIGLVDAVRGGFPNPFEKATLACHWNAIDGGAIIRQAQFIAANLANTLETQTSSRSATFCGSRYVRYPARRFPPRWSIEELVACFVVKDRDGQKLANVYFEDEPGRRSAGKLLRPR